MSVAHIRPTDEETPLLRPKPKETPIPWAQFSIVLFLQLAEPLTSQVIYPFIPQLIREIGITDGDETRVGYYVGLMQSIFFATQALTVLHWSRISDRLGRKPVILVGLFGLSLSMYSFGLARTFPGLVISRCLSGVLNGNIGVIKSMMGELTDATNVARAYAYQPIAWSTGATVGPLIGGALSRPAERFPDIFGGSEFLKTYPYFLPCAIPASFSVLAWAVTFFFLKETNPTGFSFRSLLPSRHTRSSSPCSTLKLDPSSTEGSAPPAPTLRDLLTPPVILSTATYALLSLLDIAYRALQPVFYSTPRSLGGLGLPPHAIGWALAVLGLANGFFQVGCFARMCKSWGVRRVYLVGIACAAPIFMLFPTMSAVVRAEDRATSTNGLSAGAGTDYSLSVALVLLLALQLALTLLLNTCYGCVFIYITAAASAPSSKSIKLPAMPAPISSSSSSTTIVASSSSSIKSPTASAPKIRASKPKSKLKSKGKKTLGAVNGLAQLCVSVMRCVGPYATSALYARGLAWEYGGDAYDLPDTEIPPIFDGEMSLHGLQMEDGEGVELVWRRLGGALVYVLMVALVGVTLTVGAGLPEVPWAAEDDGEEGDTEVTS